VNSTAVRIPEQLEDLAGGSGPNWAEHEVETLIQVIHP
jgi:hypothetical protein